MPSTTSTHNLQIEAPTWGDYLKGGYGDFVAQCSCGQYEYVSSSQEGQYWHWLHRTNPGARAITLLRLLLERPMPEGWVAPRLTLVSAPPNTPNAGRYTCPDCMGDGEVIAAGGMRGRFYNYGTNVRVPCAECSGIGRVDRWIA